MFEVKIKNKDGSYRGGKKCDSKQEAIDFATAMKAKKDLVNGSPLFLQEPIEDMIIDLTKDPVWVEQDINNKRRNEYPTVEECIEALMEEAEGNPEKLMLAMMKRTEVKNKYKKQGE